MNYKVKMAIKAAEVLNISLGKIGANFRKEVIERLGVHLEPVGFDLEPVNSNYVPFDPNDSAIVKRIMAAYAAAKRAQLKADPIFNPSSLWQSQLDDAYADLYSASVERAGYFLSNFASWNKYTGIESGLSVRDLLRDDPDGRLVKVRFSKLLKWWLEHEAMGRPISSIAMPHIGNQTGVLVDGKNLITIGSVFTDVVAGMCATLVANLTTPLIAEVGGGYGKLIYHIAKRPGIGSFRYVNFDLPETLCCASYFLMKAYPEKSFLLFGEGLLDSKALSTNDFILMPSFEMPAMPDAAVDLSLNQNSFGERSAETARKFVSEISRVARGYFLHLNHECIRNRYGNDQHSLVNAELAPDESDMTLLVRYPELGQAIWQGSFDYQSDTYWYLYQKNPRQ